MSNKFIEQRVGELEKATTEQIEWNRGQIDTNSLVISKLSEVFDKVAKQGEEIVELKNFLKTALAIKSPSEFFATTPSTIQAVEDVIEFEGQQYKKVDREAREGDVVVLKGSAQSKYISNGIPYKAFIGRYGYLAIEESGSDHIKIYSDVFKRTQETVDVYELIVEDKSKIQGISIEIDAPKSANQLRAEVIEKAKKFLEEKGKRFDFSINDNKRILAYNIRTEKVAFARCHPNDVFNEHIGKAIALGRALGLDVSEFENAVQPDEVVEGHLVIAKGFVKEYKDTATSKEGYYHSVKALNRKEDNRLKKIINDTNAEYEVNA